MFKSIILEASNHNHKIVLFDNRKNKIIKNDTFQSTNSDNTILQIKNFVSTNKIKTTNIKLIINDDSILTRFMTYKIASIKEIHSLFTLNINTFFPIDIEDYIIDYKIIAMEKTYTKIMINAIKKVFINEYLDMFKKLKLTCTNVDTYTNAISKSIGNKNLENNFIVGILENKISFLHMNKGIISNIRNFVLDININKSLQQELGFFDSDLHHIDNVIFIDEHIALEKFFLTYNTKIVRSKEIKSFINISSNNLPFFGI